MRRPDLAPSHSHFKVSKIFHSVPTMQVGHKQLLAIKANLYMKDLVSDFELAQVDTFDGISSYIGQFPKMGRKRHI